MHSPETLLELAPIPMLKRLTLVAWPGVLIVVTECPHRRTTCRTARAPALPVKAGWPGDQIVQSERDAILRQRPGDIRPPEVKVDFAVTRAPPMPMTAYGRHMRWLSNTYRALTDP
jgi:hypothetical protein